MTVVIDTGLDLTATNLDLTTRTRTTTTTTTAATTASVRALPEADIPTFPSSKSCSKRAVILSDPQVFCFYWTLGVMRTMPAEVTPVNLPERLFVLVFMFFALSAFAARPR